VQLQRGGKVNRQKSVQCGKLELGNVFWMSDWSEFRHDLPRKLIADTLAAVRAAMRGVTCTIVVTVNIDVNSPGDPVSFNISIDTLTELVSVGASLDITFDQVG
jgi:hypothetical protein